MHVNRFCLALLHLQMSAAQTLLSVDVVFREHSFRRQPSSVQLNVLQQSVLYTWMKGPFCLGNCSLAPGGRLLIEGASHNLKMLNCACETISETER